MRDPYELAKDILQTAETSERFTSIDLYGTAVHENTAGKGTSHHFHLENESGTGDITLYQVFPGIELVYNDMHMAYCNKD